MKNEVRELGPCPICGRPMMDDASVNKHHLMPKTFGGKETFHIHVVCHTKIHSVFTERELQHHYHTWERLREHEEMKKFIKWISKKPVDFKTRHKQAARKRR